MLRKLPDPDALILELEAQILNFRKSQMVADTQMRLSWQAHIDVLEQRIAELKNHTEMKKASREHPNRP
jgi:hypothetical protein